MRWQGGTGREVGDANGISIESDFNEDTGILNYLAEIKAGETLSFDGTGGRAAVSATETRGVVIDSVVVEAGGAINMDGTGGTSNQDSNTSDSNQGVYLSDVTLDGSSDITVIGQGGDGGALVAGIEIFDTSITTPTDIELNGTGGQGDVVTMAEGLGPTDLCSNPAMVQSQSRESAAKATKSLMVMACSFTTRQSP